jgi:hypothetical protein
LTKEMWKRKTAQKRFKRSELRRSSVSFNATTCYRRNRMTDASGWAQFEGSYALLSRRHRNNPLAQLQKAIRAMAKLTCVRDRFARLVLLQLRSLLIHVQKAAALFVARSSKV